MAATHSSAIRSFSVSSIWHVGSPITRPYACATVLLSADLAALALGASLSILIWSHFGMNFSPGLYVHLWPLLFLFPPAYALAGLYPGFGRNPAEELRRLSTATSIVYAALAVTLFLSKDGATYSRATFLLAWAQSLLAVPLMRAVIRRLFAHCSWWGETVAVIGSDAAAFQVAEILSARAELGIKPILLFHESSPVPAETELRGVRHAIVVASPESDAVATFRRVSGNFRRVTIIPDLPGLASLWVEARDFGGTLGLEIRQRLLDPGARFLKRSSDVFLVLLIGLALLPFVVLITLCIKVSSPGPAFYGQKRCGRHGRTFIAWKFRSMVVNASQVLERHLASNPELRAEWERDHKLKHDPRITCFGRFLRRTSMDELPQLWNVLMGEMSLVGPRPIVAAEIERYGEGFGLYNQVSPGLTGLWQVSGRNMLPYQERVNLDLYYVRNWSPWLDLYILARTVTAVVAGRGAY